MQVLARLEEAVARAVYLYGALVTPALQAAYDAQLEVAGDIGALLGTLLDGLRSGSSADVRLALREVKRVGWLHPAVSAPVVGRIMAQRARMAREGKLVAEIKELVQKIRAGEGPKLFQTLSAPEIASKRQLCEEICLVSEISATKYKHYVKVGLLICFQFSLPLPLLLPLSFSHVHTN
jgi:hypothetical protein